MNACTFFPALNGAAELSPRKLQQVKKTEVTRTTLTYPDTMRFQSQRRALEDKKNTVIVNNNNSASRITKGIMASPSRGATPHLELITFFMRRKGRKEMN